MPARKINEQHHWWPRALSAEWKDPHGMVSWVRPNGEITRAPPKNFGVIGRGHSIQLGQRPGEVTPWDQNFEAEYQEVDNAIPSLITWFKQLNLGVGGSSQAFKQINASEDELQRLAHCMISLAVRSPMNRRASVALAERLSGPLSEPKRNAIIAMSIRDAYRKAAAEIGTRGKFLVLYSPNAEFIFGDGFCSNVRSPFNNCISPELLVPMTPEIAVLFVRPHSYVIDPKIFSKILSPDETLQLNRVVQAYSKEMLFFRSQKPELIDEYRCCEHLQFTDRRNPVSNLSALIPGVRAQNWGSDYRA